MNDRSLAFRLAVWYALLMSATFALVGMAMFYGLEQYLRAGLADSLRRRSTQIEQILAQVSAVSTQADIAEAIETRVAPEFKNRFVRVTRAPGEVIFRSGMPGDRSFDPGKVPPLTGPWPARSLAHRIETSNHQWLMGSTTPLNTASGRYLVELGASLEPVEAVQTTTSLLGLLLPVLVACAAGGGYLLVGRALRPVDRMAQTAEQMIVQDLDARLPVVPSGDALERLAISLNHMRPGCAIRCRLRAAFSPMPRTSCARRSRSSKGSCRKSSGPRGIARELRERIGSVLEEVARLEHLVPACESIATGRRGGTARMGRCRLAELAAATAEQMRLMAEDRGIQLEASALHSTLVRGDLGRLKQIIVNLLDNAIRFTPRGGTVSVQTIRRESYDALEVRDTGIGIPAAALPHIFDRFFRADAARSREDGGAGLGLSIVRSICVAHRAQIEVDSEVGRGQLLSRQVPTLRTAADPRRAAGVHSLGRGRLAALRRLQRFFGR